MARAGFYDQNRGRAFPFLAGSVGQPIAGPPTLAQLPAAAVVDCGFIAGARSGFDSAVHGVRLVRLVRDGDRFDFFFAADAPLLAGHELVFRRRLADERYAHESSEIAAASESLSESVSDSSESLLPEEDCGDELWSGYLVTGDVAALAALLPGDGAADGAPGQAAVEPGLVQNLAGGLIGALGLANLDRTRVQAAEGCDPLVDPFLPGAVLIQASCLRGPILFKDGFNVRIEQSGADVALTFLAAPGLGAGQPCAEPPLAPGEAAQDNGLFGGGPACGEVVRSFNGVGGPALSMLGGQGVDVQSVPDLNRVVVDVDMSGMAVCWHEPAALASSSESESLSDSE